MNRTEHSILGPFIKRVVRAHGHLWRELKRQIWDSGHQSYYPRQGEYDIPVRRALAQLDDQALIQLAAEWQKVNPDRAATREKVLEHYEAVIIVEIVRRASVAAYRTIEW